MMRSLRRLFWLGVLAGGGYGAYRVWRQRQEPAAAPALWPPIESAPRAAPVATRTVASSTVADSVPAEAPARWKAPLNGDCPDGYPVKANDNSRIFHVPGGRFYARTVAERCYADAEDAIADGYRRAKA